MRPTEQHLSETTERLRSLNTQEAGLQTTGPLHGAALNVGTNVQPPSHLPEQAKGESEARANAKVGQMGLPPSSMDSPEMQSMLDPSRRSSILNVSMSRPASTSTSPNPEQDLAPQHSSIDYEARTDQQIWTDLLTSLKSKDTTKIVVRFKATGNAPVLKQNVCKISASNRFAAVIAFLRKELAYKPSDSLFVYINSSFAPTPNETLSNLYKMFQTEGHLIVNYSTTAAWG